MPPEEPRRSESGDSRRRRRGARNIIRTVRSSTGADTRASSPATSKFTARRLKSAFGLWRGSVRRTDFLIAGIFSALSLGIAAYVYARAHAAARLEFAQHAQVLQAAITKSLNDPLEDLSALQSFLEAYGTVTRRQFQLSTEPLLRRHVHVYAFEWLPVVREGERKALEGEARTAGLSNYHFWESGTDGTPRDAGRRGMYVPIHYMEPPNALALGLDIAASPDRWETATRARDSGTMAASAPFRLIEDASRADTLAAVAVYAPVYVERDPGSPAARRDGTLRFRERDLPRGAAGLPDGLGPGGDLRRRLGPGLRAAGPRGAGVADPGGAAARTRWRFRAAPGSSSRRCPSGSPAPPLEPGRVRAPGGVLDGEARRDRRRGRRRGLLAGRAS